MSVIVWTNKPSSVEPVSEAGLSPSPRPVFPQFVTHVFCTSCTEVLLVLDFGIINMAFLCYDSGKFMANSRSFTNDYQADIVSSFANDTILDSEESNIFS